MCVVNDIRRRKVNFEKLIAFQSTGLVFIHDGEGEIKNDIYPEFSHPRLDAVHDALSLPV